MTELEQLETDAKFASLKKLLDKAGSLDSMQTKFGKRGGLTIKQARLFAEYYQKKGEEKKKLEARVRQVPLTIAKIRYQKIHPKHKISRLRNGRISIRNTKGRFVKIPRYFKQAIKGVRSKK